MTPEQLDRLRAELTKPKYANLSHKEIADAIHATPGTIDRMEISGGLLVASIVREEFAGLTAVDRDYLQLVCACPSIPMTATMKAELGSIFPAGSKTRENFIRLLKQQTTLSDELGVGSVTPSTVADALRNPRTITER